MSPPAAGRALVRRLRPPAPQSGVTRRRSATDLAARLRVATRSIRVKVSRPEAELVVLKATHGVLDSPAVGAFLVGLAADYWPLPAWAVAAADPEGQIRLVAARSVEPAFEASVQAVGAWVVHGGAPFATGDLRHDPRVSGQHPMMAVLAFPLIDGAVVSGALVGLDPVPAVDRPVVDAATRAAWQALLGPAARALAAALRVERAEALSVTDDLTRLYNSRFLGQALRRETKRAVRSARPLSLLFIDIDGFKAVNDTYGHLHGSRTLVEVGAVIRASARESDVPARYGGDEFAVVLPDTNREGALFVAERIRERIAAQRFLTADRLDVRLTASVGVATLPDHAASADELVQAADRAMYRVKAAGKNGVQLATD